ncbi:MAG TPA: tetratricopeptide repeat protein [Verrucomicrobiae bacterium]|nr:tetratricopeptide repeat protein [Verrucomicrobiae bacterium]
MGFFENLFGGDKSQQYNPSEPPPLPLPQHENVKREPFPPGSVLLGKYKIIRKLGEGGFGVVLLAKGKPNEPLIALKVVRSDLEFAEDAIQRFKKEAGIWINMDVHPNIVQAHFFEAVGGQMVIGIDYIEADANGCVTLADHIRRGIEPKHLMLWATDVCKGMSHALSKGLKAHRDLKPTNILIADADYFRPYLPAWRPTIARVSDFGLAGQVMPPISPYDSSDSLQIGATVAGEISGTPAYMAPEQFDGLIHCSERSDIYSFGLILYECVAGKLPVRQNPNCRNGREIWADFARQHREKNFAKLDSLLWPIIAKCIGKNPADRFGSFSEIELVLYNLLIDHFEIVLPALEPIYERDAGGLANKAASLVQLGEHTAALKNIERALEMEPANAGFLINKANILLGSKKPTEALETCRAALTQSPNHAGCWITLGLCLKDLGQTDEAIGAYRKALELDSTNHVAFFNLGTCLAEAERRDEAVHFLKQAVQFAPAIAAYHFNLGQCLLKMQHIPEAKHCLNRAIELDATDSAPHKCLGDICYLFDNNLNEAEKQYRKALELNPKDHFAWHALGCVCGETRRYNDALACFRKAVEAHPGYFDSWKRMGQIYADARQAAEAVQCYERCTAIEPQNEDAWIELGYALLPAGQPANSMLAFVKALKLNSRNYTAWCYLGQFFERAKCEADAREAYSRTVAYANNSDGRPTEDEIFARQRLSLLAASGGKSMFDWNEFPIQV